MKKIVVFFLWCVWGMCCFAQTPFSDFSSLGRSCDRKIDDMVHGAIENKIIPGCQILAMSHGKLVYYKNFGYLKYDSILPVNSQTMYDVASMTKSLATTLAVMKLYDNHDLRLTDTVGMYLDYAAGTGVGKLTLAELLTHTSGLAAFVPFYREISPKGVWDSSYLCSQYSDTFCVQVADHVFLRYDYPDTVRHKLAIYRLNEKKYVYSDLGFVLLKEIVEKIAHQPMDSFLMEKFYVPMGLTRTGFNPRNWTCADNIAPTEEDRYFRKQVLQGYVHDQTAAVFGGVCGNAGLFSTASEVAAILQMLMNEGSWQGKCYLSPLTVKQFVTTCPMHGCQRRGLGFDTPSFAKPNAVLPEASSRRTFGHQGFTGTVFWCDPEEDFIYIFLSNRVYPSAEENKLSKSRLRLLVHEEILKALHAEKQ